MQGDGHAGAADTQQDREEFMGDDEGFPADTVVPHENPAGEALSQPAASIGDRRLAALCHEHMDVVSE